MKARDIFGQWIDQKTGKVFTITAAGIEFFCVRNEEKTHAPTYTKDQVVAMIMANGWVKKGA